MEKPSRLLKKSSFLGLGMILSLFVNCMEEVMRGGDDRTDGPFFKSAECQGILYCYLESKKHEWRLSADKEGITVKVQAVAWRRSPESTP